MITPLQTDLLKIAADKGLLALIAVIAGFWLNRILERFRAKNTYVQKLMDAKLKAYGEVSGAILAHSTQVMKLRGYIVNDSPVKLKEEMRDTLISKGYKDVLTSNNEAQASVFKNLVFLPEHISSPLLQYFDINLEITDLLTDKTAPELPNKFDTVAKKLLAQGSSVHQQIVSESNRNPFDKEGP